MSGEGEGGGIFLDRKKVRNICTDIGTEELAHLEMIGTMVKQLTKNASIEEIEKSGLAPYYADHDKAVYPVSAAGVPFTAAYIQSKGDPITDLMEDMAAEQKARSTYEYLINLADDPDVIEPLKFLREREVVHFQRFGEALRRVQDYLAEKRVFTMPDMSRVQGIRYSPNASNTQTSPYANEPNTQVSPYTNAPNTHVSLFSNTPNTQVSPFANLPNTGVSPFTNIPNSQVSPITQNAPNTQVSPITQNAPNAQVSPFAQNAPDIQTMPMRDSNIAGRDTANMSNVQGLSDPNMSNRYTGRYDNKYESKYDNKYESKYESKYDNKYDGRYRR